MGFYRKIFALGTVLTTQTNARSTVKRKILPLVFCIFPSLRSE